jgi:hypothetical protein
LEKLKKPLSLINQNLKFLQDNNESKITSEGRNCLKNIKTTFNDVQQSFEEISLKTEKLLKTTNIQNKEAPKKKIQIMKIEINDEEEDIYVDPFKKEPSKEMDESQQKERKQDYERIENITSKINELTSEIKKEINQQGEDLCI